jgi:hypothetical protein
MRLAGAEAYHLMGAVCLLGALVLTCIWARTALLRDLAAFAIPVSLFVAWYTWP